MKKFYLNTVKHKLIFSFLGFALMAIALISMPSLYKSQEALIELALKEVRHETLHNAHSIEDALKQFRGDILTLSNTPPPRAMIRAIKNNGVDPLSQDNLPTWVKRFTTILLATARAKGFYQQLRFLYKGQEVVRVDFEDNQVKTISGKKLQDKSGSDYILETIKLQEGEIYISELNLNREHGKIQVPHTPIIRFSTPVFARGIPVPGVVVLNVYASSFLDSLKLGSGEIKLSNETGYFLHHPETHKTFGFDLRHETKIFDDLPEAMAHFKDKKSEFYTDFVENKVVSLQKIHFDPLKPERYWLVSRTFSAEKVLESITALQWQILIIMLIALPMVFLLAAFLAGGISRPLSQAVNIANEISRGNLNVDVPITNKNDEPSRLLKALRGMAQNLYEKDKALQASKQHFQSILDIAVSGIISINGKGIVQSFNPAAEKIFGYTARDILGQNVKMLIPEPYQSQHDDYIDKYARTSQAKIIGFKREVVGQRKNGSVFSMELDISKMEEPGGRIYVGMFTDITKRKEAEKEILKLSVAVEQSSSVIIITNIKGDIEYVNPKFEKVTGYSSSEAIGKNPRLLKSDKMPQNAYENMWETILDGKEWREEIINKKKNGELYWAIVSISPVRNAEGKINNFLAIQDDITERKRMEAALHLSHNKLEINVEQRTAELLKSNKRLQLEIKERKRTEIKNEKLLDSLKQAQKMEAIGTLAGGIAHDFNNILTPIIGYTEISLRKLNEDSEISANLRQVLNSAHRAKDMVKHILTFSRKAEQKLEILQLSPVIKEVLKLIKATMPSTIEIHQNIDENSGTIIADLTQMHQMLMNLCINAEQAMRERGGILEVNLKSVHVDTEFASAHTHLKEGPYLKLSISDTGHGMSKTIIEKIFDPFFTTKEVGKGTGMGLATVHGIVMSHDGEIIVKSEPEKSTTFEIYIPKVADIISKKKNQPLPLPLGKERILIVDDEKEIARIGKILLESLGYEVVAKFSSLEALETFKNDPQRFDLVITDQTMPDMTGEHLAKEIMQIRPETPIILCTGFSYSMNREKAKKMGIREFIMKPFITSEIAITVRQVLDQNTN